MEIIVNNIKIHYEIMGKGKPIILLNPNSVNTGLMKFIALKLKNNYQVYIFDRRCCGKSEKNCNLTYEESAKDVYEFINKLNIEKPYLLGCSGGASVAINVGINYPESISKLVLCSGVARFCNIKMPKSAEMIRKLKFLPSVKKAEKFYILNESSKNLNESELNKINAKTLIVNGGIKDIVPIDEACFIHENISDSELFILEKESHCSYIYNNKEFYNKLVEFLGK